MRSESSHERNRSTWPEFRWLCTLLFLTMISSLPATARELTNPLTAEEVACNELQLERLLHRMNAAKGGEYHPPELPNTLLVSYSNASGFYDGLVATSEFFRLDVGQIPPADSYEQYLAFNINPSIRTLLLDPKRPELPQVSLNREQSGSSLVRPGSWYDIVLTLDPTLGRGDSRHHAARTSFCVPLKMFAVSCCDIRPPRPAYCQVSLISTVALKGAPMYL